MMKTTYYFILLIAIAMTMHLAKARPRRRGKNENDDPPTSGWLEELKHMMIMMSEGPMRQSLTSGRREEQNDMNMSK